MYKSSCLFFLVLFSIELIAQSKSNSEGFRKRDEKEFEYPESIMKDRYRVAVLTPMYLDSVELEPNLTHLPKFIMPGLDFYKGVEIAADTLKHLGHNLDVHVFDSKSAYQDIEYLIRYGKLDSMDLIIGNASVTDLKLLAEFAKRKEINFVSAVSPADAGQTFNPYFTILQPRLISHIEKMHKYINSRYIEDNVVFVTRRITSERNALQYFKNDILNSIPGRFIEMEITGDEIDIDQLVQRLDTMYNTTIILGTLDAAVTYKNLKLLAPIAKERGIKVFCMPTAEAVKSLNKTDEFPDMPVFYTSAYIIDKITPASQYIIREYRKRMGGPISDMVYKGFESLYFFSSLLKRYGTPFNDHLGENAYTFITPYKIVPVKEKGLIRFFENKYMYLLRFENGIMTYE